MKITKSQLKQIIKEEIESVFNSSPLNENKNIQFPMTPRDHEIRGNELTAANRKQRGIPSKEAFDELRKLVGDEYIVLDTTDDNQYKLFARMSYKNEPPPEGKEDGIFIMDYFTHSEGMVEVHFKTIQGNKYGIAVVQN